MIEALKYQQDQQVLQNQLTNLETLKGQQVNDETPRRISFSFV